MMTSENIYTHLHTIAYTAPGCDRTGGHAYPSYLTIDVYEEPRRCAPDGQPCAGRIWLDEDAATVGKWDLTKQVHRQADLPVDTEQYMFTHGTEHYRAGARAALAAIAAVKSGAKVAPPPAGACVLHEGAKEFVLESY